MNTHKLKMTRPEFLKKFLTNSENSNDITMEDLERVVPGSSKLIYAAYTVIMEQDLEPTDIKYVNCDDESVMIKCASKSIVKSIKATWHKQTIRLGAYFYRIKVKIDGLYLYISISQEQSDEEF